MNAVLVNECAFPVEVRGGEGGGEILTQLRANLGHLA
jgi:hypothetical protein